MVTQREKEIILYKLKKSSNYDLTNYAAKSIIRRIERFIINENISSSELLLKLSDDNGFADNLVENITVNTTDLFRDPDIWTFLRLNVLNRLAEKNKINIWLAGVSKGQEVYSLMMLLNELSLLEKSHIIATDINQKVLDEAKKGEYKYRHNLDYLSNFDKVIKKNPLNHTETFDVDYNKYFEINKEKDIIKMKDILLKKAVFIKHDLVIDNTPNYSKFDLIICRNVLIYFNEILQAEVLKKFHNSLFEKSFLLLGIHESILGESSSLFTKKGKIYIKQEII